MITVDCSRTGCGAIADVFLEGDWTGHTLGYDPFAGLGYGARLVVALPDGWVVDHVESGDEVVHCPEHANG